MIAEACLILALTLTTTCLDDTLRWDVRDQLHTKLAYDGNLVFVDPGQASTLIGCWAGTIRVVHTDVTGAEQGDPSFYAWEAIPGQGAIGDDATGRYLEVDCG